MEGNQNPPQLQNPFENVGKGRRLTKRNKLIKEVKTPEGALSFRDCQKDNALKFLFDKNTRQKNFKIHSHSYSTNIATQLVKKLLVYFLHAMHLFRLYLSIKTNNKFCSLVSEYIEPDVTRHNKELLREKIIDKKKNELNFFKFDFNLLSKSIPELLGFVDIKLFQEYINVTQVVFPNERESMSHCLQKTLYLFSNSNFLQFEATDYEVDDLLCAKRKRGDEGLKHCFKAIRKGIFNIYKLEKPKHCNLGNLKEEFLNQMFGDKDDIKPYYRENNITKETISILKRCDKYNEKAEEYKRNYFLKDQVKRNILDKKEEILKMDLNFESFAKVLLDKQKKHGWILQNILNSIEMYDACTIHLKARKRKRKSKASKISPKK